MNRHEISGARHGDAAMQIKYRYVYEDVDRHGNVRLYFQRGKGQRKVRITARPG